MGSGENNNSLIDIMGLGEFSSKKSYYRELEQKREEYNRVTRFANYILDASTLVAMIATDTNGIITVFNKGAELMLGYTAEEVVGKMSPDIFHDQEEIESYGNFLFMKYNKVIHGFDVFVYESLIHGSCEREWSYIKKDGVRITVRLTVTAVKDEKDCVIGHLGIAKDITGEKNARNLVLHIIDSMPSVIIGVDSSLAVTLWNREAELVTGVVKSDAMGMNLFSLYPAISKCRKDIEESISEVKIISKNRVSFVENESLEYRNLAVFPLDISGTKGGVLRIDRVTDQVKMEERIIQSEKMMSVGGLAAGMAHEINNPLAGILQNTQNLKRRLFDSSPKNTQTAEEVNLDLNTLHNYLELRGIDKIIEGISVSGSRASEIIKNMLSFSRKGSDNFLSVDLYTLLDNTIQLVGNDLNLVRNYNFGNISIIKDYQEEKPYIRCDPPKMQQVIYNLLKNGAEAMADVENPRFIISVYRDKGYIVTEIEDNGYGMAEETRKRVFEPFYTTKDVGKGTGLGMSISYFIISDFHKGELSVESVEGEWTRFIIKLPEIKE